MTPSTNGNILGRDQLDWASLLYVDQTWHDSSSGDPYLRRSFVNPNDAPMFFFLQAEFVNGYSYTSSNDFTFRYASNVKPSVSAGAIKSDLIVTAYAYLYPGESFCIEAVREQQVPVRYTLSVSQRSINPAVFEGISGKSVAQLGTDSVQGSLEGTSQFMSYEGVFPTEDPCGFGSVELPNGFSRVAVQSNSYQVVGVRNDSGRRYFLIDTSAHDTTDRGSFQRVGNINGNCMVDGNAVRVSQVCTFNPGDVYFTGPGYSNPGGTRHTYTSLTFVPSDAELYPQVVNNS